MSSVADQSVQPLQPPLITERIVVGEPYPGAASYRDTPEDRALFAGRENERNELLNLVLSESLVVLLGRSGMGKSSLINARLLTDLRDHRFFPIAARVTSSTDKTPTGSILQSIQTCASLDREGVKLSTPRPTNDLWTFFNTSEFRSGDRSVRPILIIDQFEELFTRYRPEDPARRDFVADLADLVRRRVPAAQRAIMLARLDEIGRDAPQEELEERSRLLALLYEDAVPDVKVVLVIRDDYVAELLSLRTQIPGILRNSLRLEPLTRANARDAIVKPTTFALATGRQGIEFGDGVVEAMLDQLCGDEKSAGPEDVPRIQPLQLQILCRFLYEHPRKSPAITLGNLKAWGGLKHAVRGYYRNVMRRLPRLRLGPNERNWRLSLENLGVINRPRAAAQHLCERGLIDFSAHRTSLNAPVVKKRFGITAADLDVLVKERLIVEDPRPDTVAYELAHDSLVRPLRAARTKRRLTITASVIALLVAVFVLPPKIEEWAARRSDLGAVAKSDVTPAERGQRLQNLVAGGEDLSGVSLGDVDARQLSLTKARLAGANLDRARFDSALMDNAMLHRASLRRVSFDAALMYGANLSEATLDGSTAQQASLAHVSLRNASLVDVNLTGAVFDSTDLAGARVEDANMRDARMMHVLLDDSTSFTGTAWWLARDWSDEDVQRLSKRFPASEYVNGTVYKREMKLANADIGVAAPTEVATAGAPVQSRGSTVSSPHIVAAPPDVGAPGASAQARKLAYARRARLIATQGTDLQGAYDDIEIAYRDTATRQSPEVLDTRAYILLRRTWLGDRSVVDNRRGDAYRNARSAVSLDPRSDSTKFGERMYHLGLAFEGMLDTVPALNMYRRAAQTSYTPTYERLLTPSGLAPAVFAEVRSGQHVDTPRKLPRTAVRY